MLNLSFFPTPLAMINRESDRSFILIFLHILIVVFKTPLCIIPQATLTWKECGLTADLHPSFIASRSNTLFSPLSWYHSTCFGPLLSLCTHLQWIIQIFLSKLPFYHTLFYSSTQLHQTFPGNPKITSVIKQ